MSARRKLPPNSQLKTWMDDNKSHEEIRVLAEEMTGETISLSSVSSAISRAGYSYRPRNESFIPWPKIAVDHNWAYQLVMLRLAARLQREQEVKPLDRKRLENWTATLKDQGLVVMYKYNSVDGFYYVPARPGIDLGLIREIDKDSGSEYAD